MLRPRGPATRPVLFIQGGGAGAHDQWDNKLVASLSGALGKGWRVRYPRLPGEADPSYAGWAPAIRAEILASREAMKRDTRLLTGSPLPRGDKPLAVVGHSLGGTILAAALAEEPPTVPLTAIVLVSAPFEGNLFKVRPINDVPSDYEMHYYGKVPSLVGNDTNSNWLLLAYPDFALEGLLVELFVLGRSLEMAQLHKQRRDELLEEIKQLSALTTGATSQSVRTGEYY